MEEEIRKAIAFNVVATDRELVQSGINSEESGTVSSGNRSRLGTERNHNRNERKTREMDGNGRRSVERWQPPLDVRLTCGLAQCDRRASVVSFSGAGTQTSVTAIRRGNNLWLANCGDSRCVLGKS